MRSSLASRCDKPTLQQSEPCYRPCVLTRSAADCVNESLLTIFGAHSKHIYAHIAPRLGTVDLIKFLLERHPDSSFSLILGGDTYADLRAGKWTSGEELQELVTLEVINRVGFPPIQNLTASATLHTVPGITDASSTAARACTDATALAELVGPRVAEYICANELYAFAKHLSANGDEQEQHDIHLKQEV
jgi:hypothetical protein